MSIPGGGLAVFISCIGIAFAQGQATGPALLSTRSYSGQFIIQAPAYAEALRLSPELASDRSLVRLDPSLMPVSCERLKQLLWRELGANTAWRGKIFLVLYPAGSPADAVGIRAQKYNDGWSYRIDMPDVIERTRYVRGLVQVLLLELANRNASERSAEIPNWLIEGVTAELLASSELQVILPAPKPSSNGRALGFTSVNATQKQAPLEAARVQFSTQNPLTFEQLSWPAYNQMTGEAGEVYRGSAQLFLNELLTLANGRACLRQMVEELPSYYNWQMALFHAFGKWFHSALDVEKWWAVHLVQFTGRDLAQRWDPAESWRKLDDCLRLRVQVHSASNALPARSEISLETVVRSWAVEKQDPVLTATMRELELIRVRSANEALELIDAYLETIRTYQRDRDHAGLPFGLRRNAGRRHVAQQTVKQLAALEARRQSGQAALQRQERAASQTSR